MRAGFLALARFAFLAGRFAFFLADFLAAFRFAFGLATVLAALLFAGLVYNWWRDPAARRLLSLRQPVTPSLSALTSAADSSSI